MDNKIITEADRRATPRPAAPVGVCFTAPKGQKISPKAIMDILAKKGIEVSSPQCSTVLKNAGFKRRKRRSGEAVTKAAPAKGASAKGASEKAARKSDAVTIDEVIAAKKAAEQFGGADRLLAAVKALERLS